MKTKAKSPFIVGLGLFILFIIFTVLAATVDVGNVGVQNTKLGFSSINKSVFSYLGQSETWLTVTDVLGVITLLPVAVAAVTGLIQLIKRKSIKRLSK